MIHLVKKSDEVYYTCSDLSTVSREELFFLKQSVCKVPRKRVRICLHPNEASSLHEMLIAMRRGVEVPPHKHIDKSESFHIIEGELKVLFFDVSGEIVDSIEMGLPSTGNPFMFRNSSPLYHTVIPLTEIVIFHEITNGPFNPDDIQIAPWANSWRTYEV